MECPKQTGAEPGLSANNNKFQRTVMEDNPLLPVSLATDSYTPGLRPQDKNGRADVTALPLKRIANFNLLL
jgi:hypothetical protein